MEEKQIKHNRTHCQPTHISKNRDNYIRTYRISKKDSDHRYLASTANRPISISNVADSNIPNLILIYFLVDESPIHMIHSITDGGFVSV